MHMSIGNSLIYSCTLAESTNQYRKCFPKTRITVLAGFVSEPSIFCLAAAQDVLLEMRRRHKAMCHWVLPLEMTKAFRNQGKHGSLIIVQGKASADEGTRKRSFQNVLEGTDKCRENHALSQR